MKKNDIILLLAVIIAGIALFSLFSALSADKGNTVVITVDGKEYSRLPLNEDTEVIIQGVNGTNTLVIKDNKAYISHATCPDLVCVRSGSATELKSIVCLPNKVVVSIEKN